MSEEEKRKKRNLYIYTAVLMLVGGYLAALHLSPNIEVPQEYKDEYANHCSDVFLQPLVDETWYYLVSTNQTTASEEQANAVLNCCVNVAGELVC